MWLSVFQNMAGRKKKIICIKEGYVEIQGLLCFLCVYLCVCFYVLQTNVYLFQKKKVNIEKKTK